MPKTILNPKLERVNPLNPVITQPYIRGEAANSFFLVTFESPEGSIVAWKPIDINYPQVDDYPVSGVYTIVRVVPVMDFQGFGILMNRFGFRRIADEDGFVHYQLESNEPTAAVEDAIIAIRATEPVMLDELS